MLAFFPEARCVALPLAFTRHLVANYSWLALGAQLVVAKVEDLDAGRCLVFLDMDAQQQAQLASFLTASSGMPPLQQLVGGFTAADAVDVQVHASLVNPMQAMAAPLLVRQVRQEATQCRLTIQVLDGAVFDACTVASAMCSITTRRADSCVNLCRVVQASRTELTLDLLVAGTEADRLAPGLAFLVPLQGPPQQPLEPVTQGASRFALRAGSGSGGGVHALAAAPPAGRGGGQRKRGWHPLLGP